MNNSLYYVSSTLTPTTSSKVLTLVSHTSHLSKTTDLSSTPIMQSVITTSTDSPQKLTVPRPTVIAIIVISVLSVMTILLIVIGVLLWASVRIGDRKRKGSVPDAQVNFMIGQAKPHLFQGNPDLHVNMCLEMWLQIYLF